MTSSYLSGGARPLALICLLAGSSANAETLDATLTLTSGPTVIATWTQDLNPTPVAFLAGNWTEVAVSADTGPFGGELYFYTGGSITFENYAGSYVVEGPQAFAGSVASPQFSPGSFDVSYVYALAGPYPLLQPSTLTFTAAAAPEPSTWALMLLGFAGLGALSLHARRRLAAA